MKTLFISMLALAASILIAPAALAGHYERYVQYYDRCGRPVYVTVYRNDYRPEYRRGQHYVQPRRSSYYRSGYQRPGYCAPRRGITLRFGF